MIETAKLNGVEPYAYLIRCTSLLRQAISMMASTCPEPSPPSSTGLNKANLRTAMSCRASRGQRADRSRQHIELA